ncbi:MAG: hypothetical protein ABUK01_04335 [Leptospirales bacterium]
MALAAGILLILIGIAHNIYGEKQQIPALKKYTNDSIIVGSQRIMTYQGGFLVLAVGIVQVLLSFQVIELTGVARYFPIGIVLLNFFTILFIALVAHREIFKITAPQFVIFIVIITLQSLSL